MPEPDLDSPRLARAIPIAFVRDVRAAAAFYRDTLGFSIDFLYSDPPFYGSVSRDSARVHLKFVHEPVIVPGSDDRESFITIFVEVDNVQTLFAEYASAGVTFLQPLQPEPWGGQAFIVRDLDGNILCFAGQK